MIETVIGCIIILPILLILVDCAAMVVAQTSNDALAKEAARAAAECPQYADTTGPPFILGGANTVQQVVNNYNAGKPALTWSASAPVTYTVTGLPSNAAWTDVKVNTFMTVNLPVPIPISNQTQVTFQAQSVEPVVSSIPSSGS